MRKTKLVTIADEGRDKGKTFLLKEMPASQAEKWAARALLAVSKSGIELPDYIAGGGMEALAIMGIKAVAGVSFAEAEPLLDEMMGCVRIIPDLEKSEFSRPLVRDGSDGEDVQEVATLLHLRAELFTLHTGFFFTGQEWKRT